MAKAPGANGSGRPALPHSESDSEGSEEQALGNL
jgi:hypothetical protein